MSINIEGIPYEEFLALPKDELEAFVFTEKPIAFRAGTAQVLGHFHKSADCLRVELAHIDGGGEGVLPTIVILANRYARQNAIPRIEWLVYATNCARPNPKLRRVLERRGFAVRHIEGKGECYHLITTVAQHK